MSSPATKKDVRCENCNTLLFKKASDKFEENSIWIKCRNCKKIVQV